MLLVRLSSCSKGLTYLTEVYLPVARSSSVAPSSSLWLKLLWAKKLWFSKSCHLLSHSFLCPTFFGQFGLNSSVCFVGSNHSSIPFLHRTFFPSLSAVLCASVCQKAYLICALRNLRTFFTTQWSDHLRSLSKCRAPQGCWCCTLPWKWLLTLFAATQNDDTCLSFQLCFHTLYTQTGRALALWFASAPIWLSSLL